MQATLVGQLSSLPVMCQFITRNEIILKLKQSSTWCELKCIRDAFNSFVPILHNHNIQWFTDNQAVETIVHSGSMNLELHNLAVDIFFAAQNNNIGINFEWIPRTLNDISVRLLIWTTGRLTINISRPCNLAGDYAQSTVLPVARIVEYRDFILSTLTLTH